MSSQASWIFPQGGTEGSLREIILRHRGLTNERDQALFATHLPPLSLLNPPATLPGADAAAEALDDWIKQGLSIAIYGDYDADGICAAAIVSRLLGLFDAKSRVFIPHRIDEGYGLHAEALKQLQAEGVQAVITVDCGIRSFAEAEVAAQLGLRLIITDHHRVDRAEDGSVRLPKAQAVAHPSLGGCPFEMISGSVVAFKVAKRLVRLRGGERPPELLRNWVVDTAMPLAAIGLVADVMPLLDENRVLVANTVQRLATCGVLGVQAILREAGVDTRSIDARTISHQIAPRLNATGRLEAATDALLAMQTLDESQANTAAYRLETVNTLRKQRMNELIEITAAAAVAGGFDQPSCPAIVMADTSWHPGLIGLAAARLVDRFHKPVVLCGGDDLFLKISGRSPPSIDLHACMQDCTTLLAKFGGHAAAAGGSIDPANMPAFMTAFEQAVLLRMHGPVQPRPVHIDISMPIEQAMDSIEMIRSLRPFGKDFVEPVIHCSNLCVRDASVMGKGGVHLKIRVNTKGSACTTELMWWQQGARVAECRPGRMMQVVGGPKPPTNPRFPSTFVVLDLHFEDAAPSATRPNADLK